MQLCYHNIMRLGATKLKEAIFYSCQLIIEEREGDRGRGREEGWRGGVIPIPLKAAEERGMEVMEGWKGAGFEVRAVLREEVDGELRGELFYILNVFLFFHPPLSLSLSLSGFPLWSPEQLLKFKSFILRVTLNILKGGVCKALRTPVL